MLVTLCKFLNASALFYDLSFIGTTRLPIKLGGTFDILVYFQNFISIIFYFKI
jgi:hypothetical protein